MEYIELSAKTANAEQSEILMAMLEELPFESFECADSVDFSPTVEYSVAAERHTDTERSELKAYIKSDLYELHKGEIAEIVTQWAESFSVKSMAQVNWNAVWESNFEPIVVDNRAVIRAPFHKAMPELEHEVVIMPKMSFGTGHHATTYLMVSEILRYDFTGMSGLDMGSGTGVLAIMAVRMGAVHVDAIDIDQWAYTNCMENIAANGVSLQITPMQGDASLLGDHKYDFILANINRNILLCDMSVYVKVLSEGGVLIVSGILERDMEMIQQHATSLGLQKCGDSIKDGWAAIRFGKL